VKEELFFSILESLTRVFLTMVFSLLFNYPTTFNPKWLRSIICRI